MKHGMIFSFEFLFHFVVVVVVVVGCGCSCYCSTQFCPILLNSVHFRMELADLFLQMEKLSRRKFTFFIGRI